MWEFFQIITKAGMTPNECLSLFAVNMKITPHHGHNIETLLEKGLIEYNEDKEHYTITKEARAIMTSWITILRRPKKKTDIQFWVKIMYTLIKCTERSSQQRNYQVVNLLEIM